MQTLKAITTPTPTSSPAAPRPEATRPLATRRRKLAIAARVALGLICKERETQREG